jgi:hypothetical protein
MALKKSNTRRFVVTGSLRAMKTQPLVVLKGLKEGGEVLIYMLPASSLD